MSETLGLDATYLRMLSIVWEGMGKPDTSLPAGALSEDRLPRKLLGLLAATGRGAMASGHLRDDGLNPFDRSYAPPGWGHLHGHRVEELYGFNMELIFELGGASNHVRAWLWKDECDSIFDAWLDRDHYRENRPNFEADTFEHFLWWRYGDPKLLLPEPSEDDDENFTLESLLSVRYHLRKMALDLSGDAVAGFAIPLSEEASGVGGADRVRHKTFGEGSIVKQQSGKITVAFDDGSERTLLERFVERL